MAGNVLITLRVMAFVTRSVMSTDAHPPRIDDLGQPMAGELGGCPRSSPLPTAARDSVGEGLEVKATTLPGVPSKPAAQDIRRA